MAAVLKLELPRLGAHALEARPRVLGQVLAAAGAPQRAAAVVLDGRRVGVAAGDVRLRRGAALGREDDGEEGRREEGRGKARGAALAQKSKSVCAVALELAGVIAKAPDCRPAREKKGHEAGATRCALTLDAPELSPKSITRDASPPKASTLACVHASAARWSRKPCVPVEPSRESAATSVPPSIPKIVCR
jgi:hypothetical protein